MLSEKEHKHYSKFLSLILRHQPDMIHLKLDEQGWANIEELIAKAKNRNMNFSLEIIQEIVENNDKKRFIIKGDKIRANQGHSIKIDLNLQAQLPPAILYHGTATRFLKSIMTQGLQKRSRQHVHLSSNLETALKVGERHGVPVILEVDTSKMLSDGHVFYLSENNVWLTDHIPAKYLQVLK